MSTHQQKTALTVIDGGKATTRNRRQRRFKQAVPSELQGVFTQFRKHHGAIEQVYIPLQEKREDLETDWTIREEEFWQETLIALQALKVAIQPAAEWVDSYKLGEAPTGFLAVRFDLLIPLYYIISLIDNAGIAVTAYLPLCASTKIQHLQQRHHLSEKIAELAKEVQLILTLTGTLGEQKCIAEHQRRQQELATWLANTAQNQSGTPEEAQQ